MVQLKLHTGFCPSDNSILLNIGKEVIRDLNDKNLLLLFGIKCIKDILSFVFHFEVKKFIQKIIKSIENDELIDYNKFVISVEKWKKKNLRELDNIILDILNYVVLSYCSKEIEKIKLLVILCGYGYIEVCRKEISNKIKNTKFNDDMLRFFNKKDRLLIEDKIEECIGSLSILAAINRKNTNI